MPTAPKHSDNLTKHLTHEEKQLRQDAEDGVIPDRGGVIALVKPPLMTGNNGAGRYWKSVIERMEGLAILDDLDSDALGVYCTMMARYDSLCKLHSKLSKEVAKAQKDGSVDTSLLDKLDSLNGKMQSLERNILQYAEKLGLTPSGRVRLAQKRAAAAAAAQNDPDGDLFGD